MKLLAKQLLIINALILSTLLILSTVAYITLRSALSRDLEQLETYMYEQYDTTIEHHVGILISQLDGVKNQIDSGTVTDATGRLVAADIIRNAWYGEEGYFWADDLAGNNIVLLGGASEGTNRINLQDVNGEYIVQNLIQAALAGGGYTDYYFPRAGETQAERKRGYSALYEPFGWVIGTGNYLNDIEAAVIQTQQEHQGAMNKALLNIIIVALLMLVVGCLIATLFSISLTRPIKLMTSQLQKIADLNISPSQILKQLSKRKDEIGMMATSASHLENEFREMVQQIQTFSDELSTYANNMRTISTQTKDGAKSVVIAVEEFARGAQDQAHEATDSVESLNTLNQLIDHSNTLADEVLAFSEKVASGQHLSNEAVTHLVSNFDETVHMIETLNQNIIRLSEHSNAINAIVTTIDGIANQTNLLALNASIEAARAGEAGKGFAVVASEIRNLAEQTSHSTTEINSIIELVGSAVTASKVNMEKSNQSIHEANNQLNQVNLSIHESSSLTTESSKKIQEVQTSFAAINDSKEVALNAISSISAVTEESAATAEEINATMENQMDTISNLDTISKDISQRTQTLSELISRFEL